MVQSYALIYYTNKWKCHSIHFFCSWICTLDVCFTIEVVSRTRLSSSSAVWNFKSSVEMTRPWDPDLQLDPDEFSIRLNAADYDEHLLNYTTCEPLDPAKPGLQAYFEAIPAQRIAQLREGVARDGKLYSWYADYPAVPANPLREGVLPNGGTAHWVVQALAARAEGKRWPACEEEMKQPHGDDPRHFKC